MIKAIVFDFDGVIVRNSEFGKDKGWERIFPDEVRAEVEAAKKKYSGGKGSRLDIIRELAPIMGVVDDIERWVEQKAKEFGDFTFNFTILDGVLAEDRAGLETLVQKYPLYLNSATPEAALQTIAETLKIEQFFQGIFGQRNPKSKVENMERAAAHAGVLPSEVLFVGDQDTDFKTTQTFGCEFVGIMNDWNKWRVGDKSFPLIAGVNDLPDYLCP